MSTRSLFMQNYLAFKYNQQNSLFLLQITDVVDRSTPITTTTALTPRKATPNTIRAMCHHSRYGNLQTVVERKKSKEQQISGELVTLISFKYLKY